MDIKAPRVGGRAIGRLVSTVRPPLNALVLAVMVLFATPGLPGTLTPANDPIDAAEPITPVPNTPANDSAIADLGERLFKDPRLSHGGDRSCRSCHDLESNGADGRQRDVSPAGVPLRRNTNTVFNAGLSFRLDWTGDVRTLQEQADKSVLEPDFMATTWPELLGKLQADPDTVAAFVNAEGKPPDRDGVLDALATYERTLSTPDSRFDLWLRGNATALSTDEVEGYRLFKSAGCVSCHQGVNVGGNLFEKNGIFRPLPGQDPEMMRVPSLRNVAVTAPYFHDGGTATLDEAVRRMAEAQLGRVLSEQQVGLITAFLRTLTGRYRGRLLTAPR